MGSRRPPLIHLARAVFGTTVTLVVLPLIVTVFYDNWLKANLPWLESLVTARWTPAIVTVIGLSLMVGLLIWPDLVRAAPSPDARQMRRTIYSRGTYRTGGTIITTESLDVIEGTTDEALENDISDTSGGNSLK